MSGFDPARYEAWYHSPRGAWIADQESDLLLRLLGPPGGRLLDVGAGTGHFTRRFAAAGFQVTALDPDPAMLTYARSLEDRIDYIEGNALELPFPDASFDHCTAVTSLCFIPDPAAALREMWRVARRRVVLGVLNRHSLLYRQKAGSGSYRGARWDTAADVRRWARTLEGVSSTDLASAVFVPTAGPAARFIERLAPRQLPWGAFLSVVLVK